MAAVATRPAPEMQVEETKKKKELDQSELLKLHNSSSSDPFVMPSQRGLVSTAPGFDHEAFLDMLAEDAMFLQREKLRQILARNADVEYLQRHGLGGRTDADSFRKCVPVVKYVDLEEDIMRLVNGEKTPIFTVDPITDFNFSSGTTSGKPKYIPTTAKNFENYMFLISFVNSLYKRYIPDIKDGKGFNLGFAGRQIDTPSGVKAGAQSTNYYRSPRFKNRPHNPDQEGCVPDEVILCDDTDQSMYCHLLCALAQSPEVMKVYSTFAAGIVGAIRALQTQWPEIVEDLRTGTLNPKITEPEMRAAVEKTLKPNPEIAGLVERECGKKDWAGIIPRLFPNAHYVACVISGSMLQYAPALRHFSGHLPTISPVYAACECAFIGLNLNLTCEPKDITYMLWPESAYYEFIPLEDPNDEKQNGEMAVTNSESNLTVLEACDLEVGKYYELVVTNVIGLYRYRLGDVLKVKGFRKTLPIFEFVQRKDVILSINADKTDEKELQAVTNKACKLLEGTPLELADYTSTGDITSFPGHYILFWEMVDSSNLDHKVLQECANTMDASLNHAYRRWRNGDMIGPLELRIVKEGTFNKVTVLAIERGTSLSTYKPPRCVKNPQSLELLKTETLVSFHSSITPDATPLPTL